MNGPEFLYLLSRLVIPLCVPTKYQYSTAFYSQPHVNNNIFLDLTWIQQAQFIENSRFQKLSFI